MEGSIEFLTPEEQKIRDYLNLLRSYTVDVRIIPLQDKSPKECFDKIKGMNKKIDEMANIIENLDDRQKSKNFANEMTGYITKVNELLRTYRIKSSMGFTLELRNPFLNMGEWEPEPSEEHIRKKEISAAKKLMDVPEKEPKH